MRAFQRLFVLCVLLLSACSAIPAAPQIASPDSPVLPATIPPVSPMVTEPLSPLPTTSVPEPRPISTVGTPHIQQGPDGAITPVPSELPPCGYQWAYQDLPELSKRFQASLQGLQAEAQANAFVFGENCIAPDGSIAAFLAMETDFNITLQVVDLTNETELGEWIVKVMQVITAIPPDQIVGPRPGRVSLTFQSAGDEKNVTFYINQYQELPPGLSPAQILQQLQAPQ